MSSTRSSLLHFGVFEADLPTGALRKNGRRVKLQPQPFKVLAMLLERPGELVTRDEIHQRLWDGDTFVDFEQGLNFAVNKLRQALGDDADRPRYVETLPRRGYRFIAPLETAGVLPIPPGPSPPPAATSQDRVIPISGGLKISFEPSQSDGVHSVAMAGTASSNTDIATVSPLEAPQSRFLCRPKIVRRSVGHRSR